MKTWMNPIARDLWVAALRSGKYEQGTRRLVRDTVAGTCEFCALGVLCEVYCENVEDIRNRNNPFRRSYGAIEATTIPPAAVLEWAGMTTAFTDYVARVNDGYRCKFDEIALMIEHCTN